MLSKWLAVFALFLVLDASLQAQTPPLMTATSAPRSLRDAMARQHLAPLATRPAYRRAAAGRHSSAATKATAGFALGFAGFLVGSLTGFVIANEANLRGGRAITYTFGIAGGGAGAALGVWLASR